MTTHDDNTDTKTSSKTPTHVAYHVRERGEGRKGIWTRIGAAWQHADAKGFNIQLAGIVPLDGHIVLRVASEQKDSK